jgi:hypothetical protein
MSEFDKTTRALLELGRTGDDPSESDVRDNRKSLVARLGAATVLGAAATATSGSAASAAAVGGVKLTTLLACVALGSAVGAGVLSVNPVREKLTAVVSSTNATPSRRDDVEPRSPESVSGAARGSRSVPSEIAHSSPGLAGMDEASPAPSGLAPIEPVSDQRGPSLGTATAPSPHAGAPRATAPTAATRSGERRAARDEASQSEPVAPVASQATQLRPSRRSIDQELELVRAAEEDLHQGNPVGALEAAADHERRFPDGALWEEREVTWILALCQTGHAVAARERAERFIAKAPTSPFADRVRETCMPGPAQSP